MIVSWSPPALRKLGRIVQHIALEDPDAAWRVHERIVDRAAQLAEFPELGPFGLRRGTRELVVGGGAPYVLAYRHYRAREHHRGLAHATEPQRAALADPIVPRLPVRTGARWVDANAVLLEYSHDVAKACGHSRAFVYAPSGRSASAE